MKGITFNGKHSFKDMKLLLQSREVGIPNKNKLVESIPFSNMEFDFSEVYGAQTYESRIVVYTFHLFDHTEFSSLEVFKIKCVNWLMTHNQQGILRDDEIKDFYFLGEVRNGVNCSIIEGGIYELIVTFECYPFKIGNEPEGHDIWDIFNFELDIAQFVKFDVTNNRTVSIYNTGANNVTPKITASNQFTISGDSVYFTVNTGTTENDDFQLRAGINTLRLTGNGTISFEFRKEVL